jgi:chemotaxis protein MotA
MNWISIGGLALGFASVMLGHIIEGGKLLSLFQPAALVVLLGGTVGAVFLQSSAEQLLEAVRQLKNVFTNTTSISDELTERITLWAATVKKDGTLSLEQFVETEPDMFAKRCLRLLIDGISTKTIREILNNELKVQEKKIKSAIKVWDAAGGYAPTIGIMTAVLGLMHVMEHLADPSSLGAGIAVAFVATIYGVGFANLLFIPIANKLKEVNQSNFLRCQMLIEAFESIGNGENTIVISERIAAHQAKENRLNESR